MTEFSGFVSPAIHLGHPTESVALTPSTNDLARARARDGAPHGTLIVADAQSAGRGRAGRTWQSPPGTNLYVSFIVRPKLRPSEAPRLSLVAGLAVADVVDVLLGAPRSRVKWPNDVRVDSRKIAGVLVEAALRADSLAWAVVGIGLNVNASPPEPVRHLATSLETLVGKPLSRPSVLASLCLSLEARLTTLAHGFSPLREELRTRCETLGQTIFLPDQKLEGLAEDLDDDGALVVRLPTGERLSVYAGDALSVSDPLRR